MLPFLESFFSLPPQLMTALGTVLGFALLGDLDGDQQNSLGNFLMLIAQIMETNATQLQLLEDLRSARQSAAQSAQLQQQLEEIRRRLDRLEGPDQTRRQSNGQADPMDPP